jgi:hypothetical protein
VSSGGAIWSRQTGWYLDGVARFRSAACLALAGTALGGAPAANAAQTHCVQVEHLRVCSTPVPGGVRLCATGRFKGRRVNYCVRRRDPRRRD